jgi:hypothetical protein
MSIPCHCGLPSIKKGGLFGLFYGCSKFERREGKQVSGCKFILRIPNQDDLSEEVKKKDDLISRLLDENRKMMLELKEQNRARVIALEQEVNVLKDERTQPEEKLLESRLLSERPTESTGVKQVRSDLKSGVLVNCSDSVQRYIQTFLKPAFKLAKYELNSLPPKMLISETAIQIFCDAANRLGRIPGEVEGEIYIRALSGDFLQMSTGLKPLVLVNLITQQVVIPDTRVYEEIEHLRQLIIEKESKIMNTIQETVQETERRLKRIEENMSFQDFKMRKRQLAWTQKSENGKLDEKDTTLQPQKRIRCGKQSFDLRSMTASEKERVTKVLREKGFRRMKTWEEKHTRLRWFDAQGKCHGVRCSKELSEQWKKFIFQTLSSNM